MAYRLLIFTLALFTQLAFGALEQSTARVAPWLDSAVKNPSCYKNDANITDSDSIVSVNTSSALDNGYDCAIDADASGEKAEFELEDFSKTVRYIGNGNCEGSISYSGDASLYKLYVANNAGNAISNELDLLNVSSGARRDRVTFVCADADSGSTLNVEATDNAAAAINVGWAYVGRNLNQGSVAQAEVLLNASKSGDQLISSTSATTVVFQTANYDPYGGLNTSTGVYTVPKTGRCIVTPALKYTGITASELMTFTVQKNSTTQTGGTRAKIVNGSDGVSWGAEFPCESGDTIDIQSDSTADNSYTIQQNDGTNFQVRWIPDSTRISTTPDLADLSGTVKIAGATNCSQTVTAGTMTSFSADTDCSTPVVSGNAQAAGTKIFGFVAPTLKPGRYSVVASGGILVTQSTSGQQNCHYEIYDGTSSGGIISAREGQSVGLSTPSTLWGQFEYSSLQTNKQFEIRAARLSGNGNCQMTVDGADLTFTLIPLSQATPAPILTDSVTTYGNINPERVLRAKVSCATSSSVSSSSGSWLTVGNRSSGTCSLTFASGVFSSTPSCFVDNQSTSYRDGNIVETSSTAATLYQWDGSGTAFTSDNDWDIHCMGPR